MTAVRRKQLRQLGDVRRKSIATRCDVLFFVKDQSCDLRYYPICSPAEKSQLKRAAKWWPSLFRSRFKQPLR